MAKQTKIAKTDKQFAEILQQIQQAKQRAFQQVNTVLVELYWNIGDYISK
jgi:molybdenum cofactor biosynthesis enzyme MoaA